jgi:hypothetical protein
MKDLRWLLIFAWISSCLSVWSVAKGIYPSSIKKRQRIALGGWILSGGLFCWLYFFIAPTTIQPAISPTAVFIDCAWDSVPMRIPASSTVHVLRLHPKLGLDWGLSEEGNLGNNLFNRPYMIRNAGLHSRSYPQSLMNPYKIVVHEMQLDRMNKVLNLL